MWAVTEFKKPASYADIEALPEGKNGELIDGELYVSPRPRPRHAHAQEVLHLDLMNAFQFGVGGPGGWYFQHEPELHLGGNVLIPDIAGWRGALPDGIWDNPGISVVPDWVCEVLSPSTVKLDRTIKLPRYARLGVPHAWFVHPVDRFVEVYRLRQGSWEVVEIHVGDERLKAEPFAEVELEPARWWRP